MVLLFIVMTCLSGVFGQNKKQLVSSRIERVTLFSTGAQVNRKAAVPVQAGKTDIVFESISPDIDRQSIQVSGQGNFTILSVNFQINYLNDQKRREEILDIQQKKEELSQKMISEKNMFTVFKQEENMLIRNQVIGGANTGLKASDLKEAVDFQRTRLTEALKSQAAYERSIQKLDSAMKKLDAQLKSLNAEKKLATGEVIVTVQAAAQTNVALELGYYTPRAGWFASYDLRVKDIAHPLDLDFKAHVFQQTGEDWKEVKLTVSNANPSESGVAPVLSPWRLGFGYPVVSGLASVLQGRAAGVKISGSNAGEGIRGRVTEAGSGESLPGVMISVKGSTMGTSTDAAGNYSLRLSPGSHTLIYSYVGFLSKEVAVTGSEINVALEPDTKALEEVVVMGYASSSRSRIRTKKTNEGASDLSVTEVTGTTTFSYEIESPYTLPSDGKIYKVDLKKLEVDAEYEYLAIPRLDKAAYLTAKIADWQELNLMEGEVSLYFEGAYLGKSVIDPKQVSDTLSISLGKDKGIVVDRRKLKEFSKRQFLSNTRTDNRAYELLVRNNKAQPVNIVVKDQLPIPLVKEITVEDTEYREAEVDETTRIVTWKYTLPPGKDKKNVLKYSVKYPKNRIVVLD